MSTTTTIRTSAVFVLLSATTLTAAQETVHGPPPTAPSPVEVKPDGALVTDQHPAAPASAAQTQGKPLPFPAKPLRKRDFASMDLNGDGYIDQQENEREHVMFEQRFHSLDTDADGRVSAREFEEWVSNQRDAERLDATP